MSRSPSRITQALSALALIAGLSLSPRTGEAETFRFTAQDLENRQANWAPAKVTIRKNRDSQDELVFVLENPTARTHAFESPGVVEYALDEKEMPLARPLRVTVAPGETVQVRVGFMQMEREPDPACAADGECYRFYCHFHRGDDDPGGTILVIP